MSSIVEIAQQATKYFQNTKKGEVHDLQQDLLSSKEATRKDAVKRVIAAMTVGKDVAPLFTDVLNCIQTQNLELKKLVYLTLSIMQNYNQKKQFWQLIHFKDIHLIQIL